MTHLDVRSVVFNGPGSGDFPQAQSITVSGGPGTTPKGSIWLCVNASSNDIVAGTARLSIGFADDAITRRCVFAFGEDGQAAASADTGYRIDNGTVVQMSSTANVNILAEADLASYETDGATLSWSAASNTRGRAVFFFGDSTETACRTVNGSATQDGTVSVTGLSFAPDFIFVASCNQAITTDGQGQESMMSFGFAAKSSSTQSCSCVVWEDQQSNTSSGSIVRDDCCAVQLSSAAATITEGARLEVSSWNADGVTFTTRNAAASIPCIVLFVHMEDTSAYAGAPTFTTSATGNFSVTAPQFVPQALFVAGIVAANVNTVVSTRGSLSIGVASAAEQGCSSVQFVDDSATSHADSLASTDDVCHIMIGTVPTTDWSGEVTSFDTYGFTINVTDASAADRPTAYLAISDPAREIATDTESVTDGVVLLASHVLIVTDTESISDGVVIPGEGTSQALVITDTEGIDDGFALAIPLILTDSVEIQDELRMSGGGAIVLTDSVSVSDGALNFLGNLIVADSDTVSISETVVLGDQVPISTTARGTLISGGSVAGSVISAGGDRGTVVRS